MIIDTSFEVTIPGLPQIKRDLTNMVTDEDWLECLQASFHCYKFLVLLFFFNHNLLYYDKSILRREGRH
jgi:hypothetical protein